MASSEDPGNNDTLAHFGIPGMKWGKRSAKSSKQTSKPKQTQTPYPRRTPVKGVTDLSPKHVKTISDVELRNRINRMQMETQYSQLISGKDAAPKSKAGEAFAKFEKGHKAVQTVLAVAGTIQKIHKIYNSPMVKAMMGKPAGKD